MTGFRCTLLLIACGLVTGCGQTPTPLSGGKPLAHWLQAVKDPNPRLRKQAVAKLGNAGPMSAQVLPALLEALQDANAKVRCEAVLALLKTGEQAKKALPALTAMQTSDQDALARTYAARAVKRLREK